LKTLIKQVTEPITAEDLKEIGQYINILVNDKLKQRKTKPKKVTGGKKTLNISKATEADNEEGEAAYDEDDFMWAPVTSNEN